MSAMSDYLEQALINHLFRGTGLSQPSNISIALCSGVPTDDLTGSTIQEVANSYGYKRKSLGAPADGTWDAPGIGSPTTQNTSAVEFDAAAGGDWGVVSGIAIVDATGYGAGNVLLYGSLTTARTVTDGDIFRFNAGDIDITLQ